METQPFTVTIELSPEQVEAIAERVAAILADGRPSAPDTWLDAAGAAEHLSCSRDRIHDLVGLRKLQPRRDGRRLLFRQHDLDAYVEQTESPWLRGAVRIASYLDCPVSRVYALASAGRIPVERDGSALIARRSELDAWVESGGARRP